MSLQDLLEKCKSGEAYTAAVVLLVGISGFGLGRLSILDETREPVRIEYESALPASASTSPSAAGAPPGREGVSPAGSEKVVASKNGTKYYLPWCAGAQKISEKNKVWFNSPAEAKRAGLSPAANCKGL